MITNQISVFLWSIGVGAILALFYDCFRFFRKNLKPRKGIVILQDILFSLLAVFIIIMSAFLTNQGEIRGYMLMGYCIGILAYLLLLSSLFLKIAQWIWDMIAKIVSFFSKHFHLMVRKKDSKKIS